jgi:hypothetical protein
VAKDARWSRVSFVYLSKIFYLLDDGKYVGSRLPDRMLLMSNYMSSKCRLKPEQHAWAVTESMKEYANISSATKAIFDARMKLKRLPMS